MSKRLKYRPVRKDEMLDISLALSQAATMLDEVALYAITTNDQELKLAVAEQWVGIGRLFTELTDDSDEVINTNDNVEPYGFGGGLRKEVNEDE